MMSEQVLIGISKFLQENDGIYGPSIPKVIQSERSLYEKIVTSRKCKKCGGDIIGTETINDSEVAVCEGDCSPQPLTENNQYRLQIENIMRECCSKLGYDVLDVSSENLPSYVEAKVGDFLRVNIVCKVSKIEGTIEKLFSDAVRHSRVNVILVPKSLLDQVYEMTAKYPVANFTPISSLRMLDESEFLTDLVNNAVEQRNRSERVISESEIDNKGLAETIESNPGAIRTELDATRVKRESSISYPTLGNYFENVCQAALMYLDISTRKLGKSGENIADLSFVFPSNPKRRNGEKIFGIVDTKSNSEKDLSEETIADKHRDYIWQATSDPIAEDCHVSHVFIVFDMAMLEANELDWYRLIEEEYESAPIDGTMVVLYASALSQMVHITQSALQRNEVNLSLDRVHEVFRPFFHYREFQNNVESEIRHMTRVDPDVSDGRSKSAKESYVSRYKECERLIVVLPEMVERRYENITSSEWTGDDEAILDRYPNQRY